MNFISEAAPILMRFAKSSFEKGNRTDAAMIIKMIDMVRRSPKYILPQHGQVGIKHINTDIFKYVRIPFPIVVFEFATTNDVDQAVAHETDPYFDMPKSVQITGSSKRIVIAMEGTSPEFKRFTGQEYDGIYVMAFSYMDESEVWVPSPIGILVPRDNEVKYVDVSGGQKRESFTTHSVPILPGLIEDMIAEYGPEVTNSFIRDMQEEVMVTVGALIALNCRNINHVAVTPSAKLNKKREKNGREPFYEYRILDIFLRERALPSGGGRRAKAIQNLLAGGSELKLSAVQGHFKHRKTGVF